MIPQTPRNKVEMALCDADLLHLADTQYFKKSNLLHQEIENLKGQEIEEKKWKKMNKKIISNHTIFTDYAKEKYKPAKAKKSEKG